MSRATPGRRARRSSSSSLRRAYRLAVTDDGRGFELGALGPTHLGLQSMRERAAEAGAQLQVDSSPGHGTQVVLEWQPGVATAG